MAAGDVPINILIQRQSALTADIMASDIHGSSGTYSVQDDSVTVKDGLKEKQHTPSQAPNKSTKTPLHLLESKDFIIFHKNARGFSNNKRKRERKRNNF